MEMILHHAPGDESEQSHDHRKSNQHSTLYLGQIFWGIPNFIEPEINDRNIPGIQTFDYSVK